MKHLSLCVLAVAALLAGCATTSGTPSGMKIGEFVTFTCEGGKRFQARVAEGAETVRLRYEGGWELDRKEAGVYEADGWKLVAQPNGAEVHHNGKPTLTNCKATA